MGKIIYTSWGYDMTTVDYAKIISETEKTVECVMIGGRVENDNGQGMGRAYPDESVTKSEPFRLHKRNPSNSGLYYKGQYPYAGESKRQGTFWEYEGKGNYYNSWD